ncbi:PAS domain S-box protein [Streptomyces sp. NPDC007157]|uniref:PAS domain S-box protein n=1 Tax=Streptomyces sp. NPDC007157 TaxID=3154681 RepID=UPI0033D837AC
MYFRDLHRRELPKPTSLDRLVAVVVAVASDAPLMVIDGAGVVAEWSRHAEELLGHTAGEVVGRPATSLVKPTPTMPPLAMQSSSLPASAASLPTRSPPGTWRAGRKPWVRLGRARDASSEPGESTTRPRTQPS